MAGFRSFLKRAIQSVGKLSGRHVFVEEFQASVWCDATLRR